MATMITNECINCGACEPECPNTAIYQGGVEWEQNGAKFPALVNEYFYIVPDKCTECVGFYDHEACAAVCPVDCCVPNPEIPETHEVLLARAAQLHPDKTFGADAPSRFKAGTGGEGVAAAAPAPAPAATAAPAAAPAATAAPAAAAVVRIGKVEKKGAPPLQKPKERTAPYAGELPIAFEEALEIVVPRADTAAASPAVSLLVAVLQPLLGALPASAKAELETAFRNPLVFSAAGSTALNLLLHFVMVPILATAFAVNALGLPLFSYEIRPWFFYSLCAVLLEAVWRLREAIIGAKPLSEVTYRGSAYGAALLPLASLLLSLAKVKSDTSRVGFEGYYNTAGAFDEKTERERRYGEVFTVVDHPGGYVLRLELPRKIPPSGVKVELGLGDDMPDYALDLRLTPKQFTVHGKVVDPRLRTVAATAPAFPPDFTTRVQLQEPVAGFVQRYADKLLEVVLVKQAYANRIPAAADAA